MNNLKINKFKLIVIDFQLITNKVTKNNRIETLFK